MKTLLLLFLSLSAYAGLEHSDLFSPGQLPLPGEKAITLRYKDFKARVRTLTPHAQLSCLLTRQNTFSALPEEIELGPVTFSIKNSSELQLAIFSKKEKAGLYISFPERYPLPLQALGLPRQGSDETTQTPRAITFALFNKDFQGSAETLGLWQKFEIRLNRKGKVIDLLYELRSHDQENPEASFSSRKLSCHRHRDPVVFLPGLIVPASLYEEKLPLITFPFSQFFEEEGFDLVIGKRDSERIFPERSIDFYHSINEQLPQGNFHLVGHSAGGPDARLLVFNYRDMAKRCLSITSMGSPHKGTPLAEEIVKHLKGEPSLYETSWLREGIYNLVVEDKLKSLAIFEELTPKGMESFNRRVKKVPHIPYMSLAFAMELPFEKYTRSYIHPSARVMKKLKILKSDGTVPTESQKFGRVIAVLNGDHIAETAPVAYGLGLENIGTWKGMREGTGQIWKQNFRRILNELDNLD